jgi:beta-lactamase class D
MSALPFTIVVVVAMPSEAQDLGRHLDGISGTFVMLDDTADEYTRYDPERADERFPPCSTFKIPHTAILLESGVAEGPDYLVEYDPALEIGNSNWARDQTLASAFKFSVYWYYHTLAERLGLSEERRLLRQFQYGNEDVTGGLDRDVDGAFWVDGSLRISANEQVEFLKRLNTGALGLSERTTRLTKEVILIEETPGWRLSAKTGACHQEGQDVSLWYVGYVEKAENTYYFALHMSDVNYDRLFSQRETKAREILADLGILE